MYITLINTCCTFTKNFFIDFWRKIPDHQENVFDQIRQQVLTFTRTMLYMRYLPSQSISIILLRTGIVSKRLKLS